MNTSENVLSFADFRLDVARGVLERHGRLVPLRPRSFELLIFFLRNVDRVVSKQEIIDVIWKRSAVTDDALTQTIRDLRKVLGDDGTMLQAVPKRGYIFSSDHSPASLIPAKGINSEEIEERQNSPLRVRLAGPLQGPDTREPPMGVRFAESLTSVMSDFRWISLIDGVGKANSSIDYVLAVNAHTTAPLGAKVTIKLVAPGNSHIVWSQQYDVANTEDLASIERVTLLVATTIEDRLVSFASESVLGRPNATWSADENFIVGRFHSNRNREVEAELFYRRATELNPRMVYAHSGRAIGLVYQYCANGDPAALREAEQVCETALMIDNNDSSAHHAMAIAKAYLRNFSSANFHFGRALALSPMNLNIKADHAELRGFQGGFVTALAEIDDCLARTEFPPVWFSAIRGKVLIQLHRYAEAVVAFEQVPSKSWRILILLSVAHRLAGNEGEAKRFARQAREICPSIGPELLWKTLPYEDSGHLELVINGINEL